MAVLGGRPAAVWLSVVDNLTGDATFIPFTSFNYLEDTVEDRLTLPVAARVAGIGGSLWRTDLVGYERPFGYGGEVHVRYRPSRPVEDCGGVGTAGIDGMIAGDMGMDADEWWRTLCMTGYCPLSVNDAAAGYRMFVDDVLGRLPACAADDDTKGGLEVSIGSWFAGYSRTYTTRADGGTYGSMLPLYPPGGWPQQHFAGIGVTDAQRINVGLYNGLDRPVAHRLDLYAADGARVATGRRAVQPYDLVQLPLEVMLGLEAGSLVDGVYGLSIIPLDEPDSPGRSWAYVSFVDKVTHDPVNLW